MPAEASERTKFRRALQAALAEQLVDEHDRALEVTGGMLDGPQERDIACVWWAGKRPHRAAIEEENVFRIRLFRRFKQDQGADTPRVDQAELIEQASERLEAALKAVLTSGRLATVSDLAPGDPDFFNVLTVQPNYPGQYVETEIVAFARNRSAPGM